jgi:hypothetical protein
MSIEEIFKEFEAIEVKMEEKKSEEKKEEKPKFEVTIEPRKEEIKVEPKVEAKVEVKVEEVKVPEKIIPIEEEQSIPAKEVYLIFGGKGEGKTTVAFSFPGEILCLSFDRKSSIIKYNMYGNDKRIHIFDVVKLMDYSTPERMLESAEQTYNAILELLTNYPKMYPQPDWVVIDAAQIFHQVCEFTMRKRHGIGPFEGIANLNVWKERRMYIRDVHYKALNLAKRGVIYTTHAEFDEVIISSEVVHKKKVPAWIDVLIYETDYVLMTEFDEKDKNFVVKVVTSKNDKKLPTGKKYIVTGRRFWDVVGVQP